MPLEARRRPHQALAAAMTTLIERRYDNPLAGLPIVTAPLILEPLPDEEHDRPADLVDLYPGGVEEYRRAMGRLAASTLRRTSA